MKHFNFWALALTAIIVASCTSEDDLTLSPPANQAEEETMAPILFTSSQSAFTRAEFTGAEAAKLLGNKFVVFGYKGKHDAEKTGTPGATVFDNYQVKYQENTANTTESNTKNWEYVGLTPIKHATDNGITQQTIKYWDYTKDQYDFIAWSTGSKEAIYEGIPTADTQVLVSEIQATSATTSDVPPVTYLKDAYTFTGTAEALRECYISDLVTVYKGKASGTAPFYNIVENGYNKDVTLKFRQLGTKVRIGLYETIPGYSVKNVQFYSAAASNDADADAAKIFTTQANQIYTKGTYTVHFPTVDQPTNADNNQAHVTFAGDGDQSTTVEWGALKYTIRESGESSKDPIYLGRTSNTASFAGDPNVNYYVVYLPNQTGTNLNLRVNYTLESIDGSKEEINVKGATAQVPLIYTQWKPGYAYTYLFKISDKTNGHTGNYNPLYPDDTTVNSDPAGLYPITFDAVVVNAEEDKVQETITSVSTPSITTYQKGSNVVNQNEYKSGAEYPIFVTVNDGNTSYELVTGLTSTSSVAGYYTKSTEDVYTEATGEAVDGTTYYTNEHVAADPQPTVGNSLTGLGLYTKSTKDVYNPETGLADTSKDYYRMVTTVESGKVVTLTASGDGQAALYTLPTGKVYTEADVVDAMQMQDDDAPTGTVKGRSGLILTPATFTLEESIEYGVDGNAIDLTTLPSGSANAMKFTPTASTSYAFVYTKKAKTGEDTKKYQAKSIASGQPVNGYYRYNLIAAPTPTANTHTGDVEKGVTYFGNSNASADAITAFLGQGVSNLYILDGTEYKIASGYAQTGTTYYYTTNGGQSYTAANAIAYADFTSTTLYYYDDTANSGAGGYVEKSETTPKDGRAYYLNNDGTSYCVIYPQRTYDGTTQLYIIDKTEANITECGASDTAVKGMTYFDMYTQNDGVYYVKVIKVE